MSRGQFPLEPGGALEGGLFRSLLRQLSGIREPRPGERVGPYRIERELGRGGSAVVYLAHRDDGAFDQTVALKWLRSDRPALGGKDGLRREQRLLASLDHPRIARIVDGGSTDDGMMWFAMDFVAGERIDQHVATLSVPDRLMMFRAICEAVHYAHSRGVIHGDIKPPNILVDERGQPRLLDFGIARIQHDIGGTQPNALTPDYASPEQRRGETLTTASDIYQLGRLLADVTGTGNNGDAGRDLHSIINRATHADARSRYASATALDDDVSALLALRPVAARNGGVMYRGGRWLRRNRVLTVLATAAFISIVSSTGTFIWQLAEQRNIAQAEAARAEQVSHFLVELFRVSDPAENRGETLNASELLARGAARLGVELSDQPALQVELALLIGRIHINLGQLNQAAPLLDRALTMAEQIGQPEQLSKALTERAWLDQRRGAYADAMAGLARAESLLGPRTEVRQLTALLNARGLAERALGDFQAAEASHRRALALDEAAYGNDAIELGPNLHNLSFLLWKSLDRRDEARPLMERALALYRDHHGELHPHTAGTMRNLGWLLSESGEFDSAEQLLRRSMEIDTRLHGEDTVEHANMLLILGNFESDRGRRNEAIKVYEEAYQRYLTLLGPAHDYLAFPLHNMGLRYAEIGDHDNALAFFDQALSILRAALPGDHARVANLQHRRGLALSVLGRHAEAKAAFAEALAIRETRLPADSRHLCETQLELLVARAHLGELATLSEQSRALSTACPDHTQAVERLKAAGWLP